MSEWTQTAEDHPVSLWELLEEERMIAHKLACSCDRHNIFVNFCAGCVVTSTILETSTTLVLSTTLLLLSTLVLSTILVLTTFIHHPKYVQTLADQNTTGKMHFVQFKVGQFSV